MASIPFTLKSRLYWWLVLANKMKQEWDCTGTRAKAQRLSNSSFGIWDHDRKEPAWPARWWDRLPQPSPSCCSEPPTPTATQLIEALPDRPASSGPAHWLHTQEVSCKGQPSWPISEDSFSGSMESGTKSCFRLLGCKVVYYARKTNWFGLYFKNLVSEASGGSLG